MAEPRVNDIRSEKLLRARTGKIIEELNRSCTEAISDKLAS